MSYLSGQVDGSDFLMPAFCSILRHTYSHATAACRAVNACLTIA